jgi:hypothetical protein
METWHRLTFSNKDGVELRLTELGLKFWKNPLPGQAYVLHVDVSESDPVWPEVADLARAKNAADIFDTTFSPDEIVNAEWVRIIPTFEQGYPQPEGSPTAWLHAVYSNVCEECGIAYEQVLPFKLAKEPRLGKNHFVSLFGTYAIFCLFQVMNILAAHGVRGIAFYKPLILSTGRPSEIVSQWNVSKIAQPALVGQHSGEMCTKCRVVKYAPHMRGYMLMKHDAFDNQVDAQLSHEWFGSGKAAYREFLVSQRVAHLFLQEKWHGVKLKPVRLVQ